MVRKSSKKGWRGIRLTEELTNLATHTDLVELSEKVDALYREDAVGGLQGVSRKLRKEISLLNKSSKTSVAVSELPLLERTTNRLSRKSPSVTRVRAQTMCDLWAGDVVKPIKGHLPSTILRRESHAPGVVPACAALSVNPQREVFEQLLVEEAAAEMNKMKRKRREFIPVETVEVSADSSLPAELGASSKIFERKSRAQKLKEQRHKQMLKEHEQRRKTKESRKKSQNKVAIAALETTQAARREGKLRTKVDRIIAEAAGKATLARGAGGRILQATERIPTEIAGSLRRIVPVCDAVLERRGSLLKRRLIEQVPETNAEYKEKVKFAKLDAVKAVKMMDRAARARCVLLG